MGEKESALGLYKLTNGCKCFYGKVIASFDDCGENQNELRMACIKLCGVSKTTAVYFDLQQYKTSA